ncbi:unnamed protein product [Closterium sp. NIES-53]
MAEREMRTVVETARTMLLHMGVKHHWWHLALRQAVWVRNRLKRASLPSGTMPQELLFKKKPDLTMARVWGFMVQFMVPEQQRGGKLESKARWGLHLEAIFYGTMALEAWKEEHGPISTRKPAVAPTDPSSMTTPLLAVEDDDIEDVMLETAVES